MRYTEKWAWGKQTRVKKNTYSLDGSRHEWTIISNVDWMRLYRCKIRAIQTDEQAREAIYAYQLDVATAITELNKRWHDE